MIVYYVTVVIWLMGIGIYGLWKIVEAKIEAKSKAKSLEVRKQLAQKYRMRYSLKDAERRKTKLLLRAVEQSVNGIAVFNLDGMLIFANDSWVKQHGYTLEEVIGKHLRMFHANGQMAKLLEVIKKVTSREWFFGEIWCIRKDRSTYPALITASPLKNYLEEPYAILEVTQNISELKQTRSEFLASASRGLRTPLSSIIGFSKSILDDLTESKEEKELVCNIHDSAQYLLKLTDQILNIAMIEAGKMELKLQELDLKKFFDEIYDLTYIQAQENGVVLSFSICESPIPQVYADKDKLKQVLLDVIGNVVKFTDKGKVCLTARLSDVFARIDIEADGFHSRKYGGADPGLAIPKKLIEMMGGSIEIYGLELGQGIKVSFILPAISTFYI